MVMFAATTPEFTHGTTKGLIPKSVKACFYKTGLTNLPPPLATISPTLVAERTLLLLPLIWGMALCYVLKIQKTLEVGHHLVADQETTVCKDEQTIVF